MSPTGYRGGGAGDGLSNPDHPHRTLPRPREALRGEPFRQARAHRGALSILLKVGTGTRVSSRGDLLLPQAQAQVNGAQRVEPLFTDRDRILGPMLIYKILERLLHNQVSLLISSRGKRPTEPALFLSPEMYCLGSIVTRQPGRKLWLLFYEYRSREA
jgi:hypothetical protein